MKAILIPTADKNACKTSVETIQALISAGYLQEFPGERFLRDAKLYDIGTGTDEIRCSLIGREPLVAGARKIKPWHVVSAT